MSKKVANRSTNWIIGGSEDKPSVAAGTTNSYYFLTTINKPFSTTNLTGKVSFCRIGLEGEKLAESKKRVIPNCSLVGGMNKFLNEFSSWRNLSFLQ